MKKHSKCAFFIGILTAFVAVVAAVSGVLLFIERKKEEEDLEHYLDCSIQ